MTRSELNALRANAALAAGHVVLLAEAATVTDVDVQRRIIEGTVVPYGEPGRTNLGHGLSVRAGAVRFRQPSDPRVIGLYGHDRERTVSRLIAYESGSSGLRGRLRVASTPLGDQLLAEAAEGVRSMLSIELDGCTIDPAAYAITDGLCEFVAHVPIGAYDSARVDSVAAAIHTGNGDDVSRRALSPFARTAHGREFITVGGGQPAQPPAQPAPGTPAPAAPVSPAAGTPAPALQAQPAQAADNGMGQLFAQFAAFMAGQNAQPPAPAQPAQVVVPAPLTAGASTAGLPTGSVPAAVPTAMPSGSSTPATQPGGQVQRLAQLQAALAAGNRSQDLHAALQDITNTGLDLFQSPAGAIGQELWSGAEYARRFVPLVASGQLTSWKVQGWRWVQKPKVADYAGDKVDIPSNPVSVEPADAEAQRVAAGWDVDRKFRDFGDAAFWTGFYAAQTESYREITDQHCAAAIVAAARDVTVDGNVPAGYAAVNVAQADVLRAAALGGAILEDTPNVRRPADYVLMNTGDWLSLMDLTNLELPAFLSMLGVTPGSFLRSDLVPAGQVILGVKPALTFYELGGGAPIRVEAIDVSRAGIDSAVYGYWATLLNRPGGIISVPLTSAG